MCRDVQRELKRVIFFSAVWNVTEENMAQVAFDFSDFLLIGEFVKFTRGSCEEKQPTLYRIP
jgi:hypothetical protein